MNTRRLLLTSAPALLLAVLLLLPFFNKAFTIDDNTFLLQAQHLLKDPLHPTAFEMVFNGDPIRLSAGLVSGPVMAFLLVPTVLFGGAEWIAHLTQLAVLLLGILATVALARRLQLPWRTAAIAALLLVSSPPVLGMAATSMADIPAMTFGVLAIERLLAWQKSRRPAAGLLAAAALALAVLSRPHLLLLFGVAAVLLVDEERWRAGWRRWPAAVFGPAGLPLLLALAGLLAFNYLTRDPVAGHHVAGTTLSRMQLGRAPYNLVSFADEWVLMFPLALPWAVLHRRRFFGARHTRWTLLLAAALTVLAGFLDGRRWLGLVAPLSAFGCAVLVDILWQGWRRQDQKQLALGLWLLLAVPAAFYDHLPAKYLVASAPAMAILIARALTERAELEQDTPHATHALSASRWLGALACSLVGLVLAVLILRADSVLAEIGRRGGAVVAAEGERGQVVWMDGGWGFQWYAMQAGARPMTQGPPLPAIGDVVVVGLQGGRIEQCPHRTLLRRERYGGPGGRVLGDGASFYSNGYGLLPWSWGQGEIGRIEVWRIEGRCQ